MKKKHNTIQSVPIDSLIENPNNPNKMSKTTFTKLVRNIQRTSLYEPIIVRKRNRDSGKQYASRNTQYEIINGHYRVKALKQLGYKTVDICVWDIDDQQSDILLATLNRLSGTAILEKKLALLERLSKNFDAKKLAELLPLTSGQIERYRNLKPPREPAKQDKGNFAEPLIFFVNKKQKEIIESAILKMQNANSKSPSRTTKSETITKIAESFNQEKDENERY